MKKPDLMLKQLLMMDLLLLMVMKMLEAMGVAAVVDLPVVLAVVVAAVNCIGLILGWYLVMGCDQNLCELSMNNISHFHICMKR